MWYRDPLEVNHQVARERPLLLPAENLTDVLVTDGAMSIVSVSWSSGEPPVEILDETWPKGVAVVYVTDAAESQLLDQSVL